MPAYNRDSNHPHLSWVEQPIETASVFSDGRYAAEKKKETIMSTLLSEHRQPITARTLRDPRPRSTPRTSARREPAAATPPVAVPRASLSLVLGSIVATLREWHRRRMARREL